MSTTTDSEAPGAAIDVPGGDGRCEVELPQFEGPLDLLLHLVRRHELDILDIPISFVCEKYLEYLEFMRALDLEAAGEYLVMAATLAYLKSRELVPSQPEDAEVAAAAGETTDPRADLIARLLAYQSYRDAAARLDRLPISGRDVFDRGAVVDVPPLDSGLAPITLYRLAEAYQRVLERARVLKSHEIVLERISVATRMQQLTAVLIERSRFEFEQLFLESSWSSEQELRAMLIVTLMSVLELVRLGVARVHQPEGSETLLIERSATAEEAERALAGYDEAVSFGRPAPPPEVEADIREDTVRDDVDDASLVVEPDAAASEAGARADAPAANEAEAANEPVVANAAEAANEPAAANTIVREADAEVEPPGRSEDEPE
ncbi:MAG TPA: segregation/condensation protein A [Nannocystaceae bacterium]|nr:segregation/condensation protein A [Nannocystaceae bacterium]